jgi:hypothetical protein
MAGTLPYGPRFNAQLNDMKDAMLNQFDARVNYRGDYVHPAGSGYTDLVDEILANSEAPSSPTTLEIIWENDWMLAANVKGMLTANYSADWKNRMQSLNARDVLELTVTAHYKRNLREHFEKLVEDFKQPELPENVSIGATANKIGLFTWQVMYAFHTKIGLVSYKPETGNYDALTEDQDYQGTETNLHSAVAQVYAAWKRRGN